MRASADAGVWRHSYDCGMLGSSSLAEVLFWKEIVS